VRVFLLSNRVVWTPRVLLAIAAVAVSWGLAAAEPLPVPSGAELESAMATIKAIYKENADKARSPADLAVLARDIFGNRESTATVAERYAVEMTALNIATKGDDPLLLLSICDALASDFGADQIALFTERVGQTSGSVNPATWPQLLANMDAMASRCLEDNRFTEAGSLATTISQFAKRARDPKAVAAATTLRKTIADRKKAHERFQELLTEANQPNADPKILLEFGRLLCFQENDWDQGVPYLTRAEDPALSQAAAMEARAATPEAAIAVAEAWAKYAEKAPPADRAAIRDHASVIYTKVIPELTGLAKIKAEQSLNTVLDASQTGKESGWIVIFRSDNPKLWNTNSSDDPRNFAVTLDSLPPTIRFVRIRRGNGQAVIAPIGKQTIGVLTTAARYRWQGSKPERFGAVLLGIIDNSQNVKTKPGEVAIVDSYDDVCSGWGFGTRMAHGGPAEACWAGKWIPKEPLEIAVTKRSLSSDEHKLLLK
jgi:hypothetical protein